MSLLRFSRQGSVHVGLAAVVTLAAVLVIPAASPLYTVINATVYVSMAVFALSLALLWGYGGILCFGQSAFFGLGAYAYAVAAINFGNTPAAALVAIIVPALFAAALGYFIFYGRLSDVYLGVITLTVTLILFKLINSTGGDAWRIGSARLGGFNGIPSTPLLAWPGGGILTPAEMFTFASICLFGIYAFCKYLIRTPFGRSVIAVRENEMRAELLGYNARRLKLQVFCISAAIAGLAGMLFANVVFVSPTVFSLSMAAQVLIWVVVGGVGTLFGPVAACILLQIATIALGKLGVIDPGIVLGVILIVFVVFVPGGILPALTRLASNLFVGSQSRVATAERKETAA
ncbi:branched-chain amino acid ABC transporter permease [Agrobacterium burrii]|uniref:Branched-chain amino acid ABC transporter permease n=1 Tax=Agrobacterium burrii TaxID=2815339 RepID=A0ABS3EK21_9HYPH|nr:branched-chain amino acid ABC transporter permease [Agrobacterium burrii]MBO0132258.1 branched-chain amino acid ABC transporter permease [Agrobacterium burrii]